MMDGHSRFERGFGEGEHPFEHPDPRAESANTKTKAPPDPLEGSAATEGRGRKVFYRYTLRGPRRACGFRLWSA